MIKNRLISMFILFSCSSGVLFADDFNQFLNKAIETSPYLQSSAIGVEQAKQESYKQLRYENPTLSGEFLKYKPNDGSNDSGYNISLTQPFRLWGVSGDKERFSQAIVKGANSEYMLNTSDFIRNISLYFTVYAQEKMLLDLMLDATNIAKTIYDISQERHAVGSISRADMLQAKAIFLEQQTQYDSLNISSIESYYELLKLAGIKEKIEINTNHTFEVKKSDISENPELNLLIHKKDIAQAEAELTSNILETVDVTASYSKEPDQIVNGVALSFPFPLFNTKYEEKRIAQLEAKKMNFLIENEKNSIQTEHSKLLIQRELLEKLKLKNENVLKLKMEVLEMFLEKYKVSQATLMELLNIKNQVIQTKENLIKINIALNQNAININYIQGDINAQNLIN